MKQFTNSLNDKTSHYSADQKLKNALYDLLSDTLNVSVDGKISEDVNLQIAGKEETINNINEVFEILLLKEESKTLSYIKNTPNKLMNERFNMYTMEDVYEMGLEEGMTPEEIKDKIDTMTLENEDEWLEGISDVIDTCYFNMIDDAEEDEKILDCVRKESNEIYASYKK